MAIGTPIAPNAVEIDAVINKQRWLNAHFLKSKKVKALFQSNLIDTKPTGQNFINAINESIDNIPEVLEIGCSGFPYQEPGLAEPGSTEIPTPITAQYVTVKAKPQYCYWWWKLHNIEKDLLAMANTSLLLREYIGEYMGTHFNLIIGHTINSLASVSSILVGDDTTEFSEDLFDQSQKIREDAPEEGVTKIFMSSKTLFDIKAKQNKNPNKSPLITEYQYNENQIVFNPSANGGMVSQTLRTGLNKPSGWAYKGMYPIVLDNTIKEGLIALIEPKAFAFMQKSFKKPLMYKSAADEGGVGTEKFGIKFLFVMHPVSFNFTGTFSTESGPGQYNTITGLTYAELDRGSCYELVTNAKESKIRLIKVKMGSS